MDIKISYNEINDCVERIRSELLIRFYKYLSELAAGIIKKKSVELTLETESFRDVIEMSIFCN